jgi:hypothetical protein
MDGRAASLTITDKIPHLLDAGIQITVISAVTGQQDHRFRHLRILPWGPAGLRFDLRHMIALRWGRGLRYKLSTGLISLLLAPFNLIERSVIGLQSQWSWMPAAVFRALVEMRRERPELVYTTGGAYSAHWAGYWIKKITGVKWIAEIHDPMLFPGTIPANRNLQFQLKLEGMICREADLIWWFTEGALASAKQRHLELGNKGRVIYPGAEPPKVQAAYVKGPKLIIGHFGSLSVVRSLQPFVEIFAQLKQQAPEVAQNIEIHCYGGSVDAAGIEAIREHQLEDYFVLHGRLENDPVTGLSGRERIQQIMHECDALLLIHGTTEDCAEYIPSKWYDYLWSKRPVLALTHINPSFTQMVIDHGGYAVEIDDKISALSLLNSLHEDWVGEGLSESNLPPIGTKQAVEAILKSCKTI